MFEHELNRTLKKQKIIYLIVIIFCFIGSLTSIFFPYLEKLNVRSGNPDLPKLQLGYEFVSSSLVLLFISITLLVTIFTKNPVISFSMNIIILGLVYLTRSEIHSQGFIDHDYDSKTGTGYFILFTFSLLLFVTSVMNMLKIFWLTKNVEITR